MEFFFIAIAASAINPLQLAFCAVAASLFRSWKATMVAGSIAAVVLTVIVIGVAKNGPSALDQWARSTFWEFQAARFVSCLLSVALMKGLGRLVRRMNNARRAARPTTTG